MLPRSVRASNSPTSEQEGKLHGTQKQKQTRELGLYGLNAVASWDGPDVNLAGYPCFTSKHWGERFWGWGYLSPDLANSSHLQLTLQLLRTERQSLKPESF